MITFTDAAREVLEQHVQEAGDECAGVRIRAAKVGNYTFRYQIHLLRREDVAADDERYELGTVQVMLDPRTAEWMAGAKIDFLTLDSGSGFQIENPQAEPRWDDPLCRRVQEVIDRQVTPVVGSHGGWIELDRVEGDTAYVQLGGGCQGCSSADFTLKQGVESVITREIPEIQHVVDVTDHAGGHQPYYR